MISRRAFILTLLGSPTFASAFPIAQLLGPVRTEYLRHYFERMNAWYAREFFDVRKQMTAPERELLSAWLLHLSKWGVELNSSQMFEHFLFSHRVEGQRLNSARFAFGLAEWPSHLRPRLLNVLKARGVPNPEAAPFGFGWDFERDEFKIYHLHRTPMDVPKGPLHDWSLAHHGEGWRPERISGKTYKKGRLQKQKLIVPMERMDWTKVTVDARFDAVNASKILEDGGTRWHFRLRSLFFPLVSESIYPVLSKHQSQFHQQADAMVFEAKDRYTFYFP